MSKSKTAIAEIKKLMTQFGFMTEEVTMKSFKLEDNTILEAKDLKVGEEITRLSDEFERVALENGKFSLVENFEIEVEDGKITSVKEIFVNAKLVDGTEIKVEGDALGEGAKVVVITPDAELPAPDGVHELEDGTKVETKDGVIVKVEEVIAEEKPAEEQLGEGYGEPMPEGEPKAPVEKGDEEPEEEDEMVAMLKDFIKKMSEKLASVETKLSNVENEFAAFKKEPAAKKIANGKTDFNKQENKEDLDDKISMIMKLRESNK